MAQHFRVKDMKIKARHLPLHKRAYFAQFPSSKVNVWIELLKLLILCIMLLIESFVLRPSPNSHSDYLNGNSLNGCSPRSFDIDV